MSILVARPSAGAGEPVGAPRGSLSCVQVKKAFITVHTSGLAAVKEAQVGDIDAEKGLMIEVKVFLSHAIHDHLVPVIAVESDRDTRATKMAMPICATSWADRFAKRRAAVVFTTAPCVISKNEYLSSFQGFLPGLAHAHSRQNAHFDLKAANILLAMDDNFNTTQICDFGLFEKFGVCLYASRGTSGYIAPELATVGAALWVYSATVSPKKDVDSACIVFAEVLTGWLPKQIAQGAGAGAWSASYAAGLAWRSIVTTLEEMTFSRAVSVGLSV